MRRIMLYSVHTYMYSQIFNECADSFTRPVYFYGESVLFPGTKMKWGYFSQFLDKYLFIILVTKCYIRIVSFQTKKISLKGCNCCTLVDILACSKSFLILMACFKSIQNPMFRITSNLLHTLFNTDCVLFQKITFCGLYIFIITSAYFLKRFK